MEASVAWLPDLPAADDYGFSFPETPWQKGNVFQRFSGFPLLILDRDGKLIFSHEYLLHLKQKGRKKAPALKLDIAGWEALCLHYNLKSSLLGINLYEKLLFLKKAVNYAGPREIYKRTSFDLPVGEDLLRNLNRLLAPEFGPALASGHLSVKSVLRLLRFSPADRLALLRLFERVSFSHSEQAKALEWLEDIAFRDKKGLAAIFKSLRLSRLWSAEMPQKKILAAIFRLRFPRAGEREREWQEELRRLRLPPAVQAFHAPFFEKDEIEVRLKVRDFAGLKGLFKNG